MFHRHVLEFSQSPGELTFRYCVGADMSYLPLKYPSHIPKNTGDSGWFEHLKMEGLAYIRSQNHCYIPSLDIPLVTWLSHKKNIMDAFIPHRQRIASVFLPRFASVLSSFGDDHNPFPKLEKRAAHVRLERHPAKIQNVKSPKVYFSTFQLFDFSTFLLPSRFSTV